MARVYLGLGANLANPLAQIHAGFLRLQKHPALNVRACSSLYASKPMGPQDQPDYVNAVVGLDTQLPADALLDILQGFEQEAGRVRLRHWGERTLDIDILLYGDVVMDTPCLTLPHPGIETREFVLIPLAEIAPDLQLPNGKQISTLAAQIERNGLDIIAPAVTMQP